MSESSHLVEALKALPPKDYESSSNDGLLCYALAVLMAQGIPPTFENITVAVFRLFPESFALIGYRSYPDATRVNRALLHARPKYRDLVVGNAKSGYALTMKGQSVARQVSIDLESGTRGAQVKDAAKAVSNRTYTGHVFVEQIEQSRLYRHWRDEQLDSVGDYEIWDFLDAVPYTGKAVLRDIMKKYREAASLAGRPELTEFLLWASKRYRGVFQGEGEGQK